MKRGRKKGSTAAATTSPKKKVSKVVSSNSVSESYFESFVSDLKEKHETEFSNQQLSLLSEINLLRVEIHNFKELRELQEMRRVNHHLQMDIYYLKLELEQLTQQETKRKTMLSVDIDNPNDSINIKNVIYNNCDQNFVFKQNDSPQSLKKSPAKVSTENFIGIKYKNVPSTSRTAKEVDNFSSVATTLFSYLSDKKNINSYTEVLKYSHEILKKEYKEIFSDSFIPKQIDVKKELQETVTDESQIEKIQHEAEPPLLNNNQSQNSKEIPDPIQIPPVKEDRSNEAETVNENEHFTSDANDLHFSYVEIKARIVDYLSDKVDEDTILTAIRRLTKAKARTLTRHHLEWHTKLLRVYLFQDRNILVQDMIKCTLEFAKDTYCSVRYYAVTLTKKIQTPTNVPITRDYKNTEQSSVLKNSTEDMIVLEPLKDKNHLPKFRVEMIGSLMISEDFTLVEKYPFTIRPLGSEVILTSHQLELLRPVVLKELDNKNWSPTSMPVIWIMNGFEDKKNVVKYGEVETVACGSTEEMDDKYIVDLTEGDKMPKRRTSLSPFREFKHQKIEKAPVNSDFSIDKIKKDVPIEFAFQSCNSNVGTKVINTEEIQEEKLESKYQINFSIDIEDSDDEDPNIISVD